jgi:hypothetical protein
MQVKIVHDEAELRWFFEAVMPPLAPTEVYFLSLSARNKYLTAEERTATGLGRTEMFAKTIVRSRNWELFIRSLRKLECDERGYTTKFNLPIPAKTMVCYLNINPSSTLGAMGGYQKIINEYTIEMAALAFGKGDAGNFAARLNKLDNNMMTCYQQATGTKHYVDIDMDVPAGYDRTEVSAFLMSKGLTKFWWVKTHSGFHLLLDRKQLSFNPQDVCEVAAAALCEQYDIDKLEKVEIIINKNAMIPLPGTLQGGLPVVVLNKKGCDINGRDI